MRELTPRQAVRGHCSVRMPATITAPSKIRLEKIAVLKSKAEAPPDRAEGALKKVSIR